MQELSNSRRSFLATAATLGMGSVAGCTGARTLVNAEVKKFHDRVQWHAAFNEAVDLSLSDGTLYVCSTDSLQALDPQTGENEWETKPAKPNETRIGGGNSDPTCFSAPFAVTDDRIYVSGCHGTAAYATGGGEQVWQYDDLSSYRRLLVLDDSLYGLKTDLFVFDTETGSVERSHTLIDSVNDRVYGPTYRPEDDTFYFVIHRLNEEKGDLIAVDPASGQIKWELKTPARYVQAAPALGHGQLYLTSNRFHIGEFDKNRIAAIDPDQREVLWHRRSAATVEPPVADGERLFVASRDADHGYLDALDPENGDTLWRRKLFDGRHSLSRPRVGESHVYVAVDWQRIHAINIDDGSEAWSIKLPAVHDVRPVYDGDTVYVSAGRYVWALDS